MVRFKGLQINASNLASVSRTGLRPHVAKEVNSRVERLPTNVP